MLNFDMLINASSKQLNTKSLSKNNEQKDNLNFEDVVKNQIEHLNINENEKSSSKNNESLDSEENSTQIIKVEIKDKESLLEDLSNSINIELDKDEIEDIVNIYLVLNMIDNNEDINLKTIEFIDVNKLNSIVCKDDSLLMDKLSNVGSFILEQDAIKIPLNNVEVVLDIQESNTVVEQVLDGLMEINNETKDVLSESYLNALEEVKSLFIDNKEKNNVNDYLSESSINIEDIDFVDYNSSFELVDKVDNDRAFNNFLINQRAVNVDLKSKNFDSELEKLIKIQNSKNDVTNIVSQYSYGFNNVINDTISENIQPEVIRYSNFESDLAQTVIHMKSSNLEELTLKVKPKELGEITINLIKRDNISEIIIIAEKEDLFDSLKRDITKIETEIKSSGLNIDNISVEIKKYESSSFDLNNPYRDNNLENDDSNKNKKESKSPNKKSNNLEANEDVLVSNTKYVTDSEISILA